MGFYSDFVRLFAEIGKMFGILRQHLKLIEKAFDWYSNKEDNYWHYNEFVRFSLAILIPSILLMGITLFKPIYNFMMYKPLTVWSFLPQLFIIMLLSASELFTVVGAIFLIFGIARDIVMGFISLSFKPKGHSFWHDVNKYMHEKKVNFH